MSVLYVALAVAAVSLAIYLPTGAPGLWWGDGPELTTAAWCLGVAHEPGYPLYMLTGHLFMKLLGAIEPIRAMAIYSAIMLAAACAVLTRLFAKVISPKPNDTTLAVAGGLGLLTASTYTVWEHATFAEVYPLTFLMAAVIISLAWPPADQTYSTRRLIALAFMLGLATTNHYSISALYPLAAFVLIGGILKSNRKFALTAKLAAAYIIPLMLYLYLPIRAAANPILNEDDPSTLRAFLLFISARRYSMYCHFVPANINAHLARWLEFWGRQWLSQSISDGLAIAIGVALIIAAVTGLVLLARKHLAIGIGLLLSIVATLAYSLLYQIYDIEPYFIVGIPAALIGWIYLVSAFTRRAQLPRAAAFLPLALALASIVFHYRDVDLSRDRAPEAYARVMLGEIAPGGVLITAGDSALYPLIYEQVIHRRRPDVAMFSLHELYAPWHRIYMAGPSGLQMKFDIPARKYADNRQCTIDIINRILLPAHRAGRQVYCIVGNMNPLDAIFQRKPVRRLLAPEYNLTELREFMVPGKILEEILPNPKLISMSKAEVAAEVDRHINPTGVTPKP